MLHEEEKAQIRACFDALKANIEGFRSRRPQLEMIAAIARTLGRCEEGRWPVLRGEHIAVIEAGTGTGKSFGALVPSLVLARSRGRRLVVSTSTVALQHQYAEKDVPALQRALPMDFTFAVAKGRRRYACPAKLLGEAADARQCALNFEAEGASTRQSGASPQRHRTLLLTLADEFESQRWSGDRDELPLPVSDDVWDAISTDRQGCSGNRCSEFARCPFHAARQRIKQADLVIANHDLVLASLLLEGNSILPTTAQTIFVFDEAHSLSAKVVEHLSARHSLRGAQQWLGESVEAVRDVVLALRLEAALLRDAGAWAQEVVRELDVLHRRIHATRAFEDKPARRFGNGGLPDWLRDGGERLRRAGMALQTTFVALREALLECAPFEGRLAARLLATLGPYVVRLEGLLATWELMLQPEEVGQIPVARWVERHEQADGGADYSVCAAPLEGGDRLRALLWERAGAVVLMSATLSSCGTFGHFLRRAGLTPYRDLTLRQLDSPFDYRTHARLVIAAMRTDPGDVPGHTQEVIERLPHLLGCAGTLVLFASARQMLAVHAGLAESLRRITLVQGSLPQREMLERHRGAIDRGERSMLFGLQSLAEGVDLPGAYCCHVVWAKLPFSVPDTPVEEARREWIEAQGRCAFIEIAVPEAAVRFKQGLGRLLRTTEDRGVVTVLDSRLVTRRWGALLLRDIPDFDVVVEDGLPQRRGSTSPVGAPG